jgi:hypothetical protein
MKRKIFGVFILISIPFLIAGLFVLIELLINGWGSHFFEKRFITGMKIGIIWEVPTLLILLGITFVQKKMGKKIKDLDQPINTSME